VKARVEKLLGNKLRPENALTLVTLHSALRLPFDCCYLLVLSGLGARSITEKTRPFKILRQSASVIRRLTHPYNKRIVCHNQFARRPSKCNSIEDLPVWHRTNRLKLWERPIARPRAAFFFQRPQAIFLGSLPIASLCRLEKNGRAVDAQWVVPKSLSDWFYARLANPRSNGI